MQRVNYLHAKHFFMLLLLLSTAGFFQNKLFQNFLSGTLSECSVGPDLGPNCLQRLTADDTSCGL